MSRYGRFRRWTRKRSRGLMAVQREYAEGRRARGYILDDDTPERDELFEEGMRALGIKRYCRRGTSDWNS